MGVTHDVINAVVEIGILCAAGAGLARTGILDAAGRHTLAQTAYHVFLPALCFTSLARASSLDTLAHWWPLLLNMGAAIGAGAALGWATASLTRPPPALRGHVIAAAGFGNVANLLLVLVGGLCRGGASRAALAFPPGSPAATGPDECAALGAAYVMTPVTVATLLQLLGVEALLRRSSKTAGGGGPLPAAPAGQATPCRGGVRSRSHELVPLAAAGPAAVTGETEADDDDDQGGDAAERGRPSPAGKGWPSPRPPVDAAGCGRPSPVTPPPPPSRAARAAALLPATPSGIALTETVAAAGGPPPPPSPSAAAAALAAARFFIAGLARPPAASTLAGMAAGCIPPVKAALFGGGTLLDPLTAALSTLGQAMVPVILVGLGAELAGDGGRGRGRRHADDAPPSDDSSSSPRLPARVYAAAVGARLVLMPALGMGVLGLARSALRYSPPDRLFDAVAHLAWGTPSAAILCLIAAREANHPRVMARLLCVSYACSVVTLPVLMAVLLN